MRGSRLLVPGLFLSAVLAACVSSATAAVVPDGDVDPLDPTSWNSDTYAYVGKTGAGSVMVDGGDTIESNSGVLGRDPGAVGAVKISDTGSFWDLNYLRVGDQGSGSLVVSGGARVSDNWSYLGDEAGSTGEVTIDGSGTRWFNIVGINVGNAGSGTLNIINGGWVRAWYDTYVAREPGSTGMINFGASGGSLETGSLLASPVQLAGIGTVDCRGLVSDVDLVFDTPASLSQTIILNSQPGQNITVNLDLATDPSRNESLGAGWMGDGSLTINNGITVESDGTGYLGYHAGSKGTATIDGTDSTWDNRGKLYVGNYGNGALVISAGGSAENTDGYVGYEAGATGEATVDGEHSTWDSSRFLHVGFRGHGALAVTGGGSVNSDGGSLGAAAGSRGEATVSGSGSTWENSGSLTVGGSGHGTLTIAAGGSINVEGSTYIAQQEGSDGEIAFGPGGGSLTTRSLYTSPTQWAGTGTVNTRGLVSDVDLTFDNAASLTQTLKFDGESGQDVTVELEMSDPDNVGDLGVGYAGRGSLVVRNGAIVESQGGWLGYKAGSTGTATVSGPGSAWICDGYSFHVGYEGNGSLAISDGGSVSSRSGTIGYGSDSKGSVVVSGSGSTWTVDSQFNVGDRGRGSLRILDGGQVSSVMSSIGYNSGSTGEVLVSGLGSQWTAGLFQAGYGRYSLLIADGGRVEAELSMLEAYGTEAYGDVLVTGPDSNWTNTSGLYANGGSGILSLSDGATATARACSIAGEWLLAIEVSRDTRLAVESGENFSNRSTVRIIAGARPAADAVYTPIVADTLTGSGVYQAVGGTWDETAHTFTASAVETAASGAPIAIDLAEVQRIRVDDAGTGWSLGASFLKAESPTTLGLTATAIDGTMLAELEALLGGEEVLGAWEFAFTSGYAQGDPAYLSFVAADFRREDVTVWHHDGSGWSEYDARDLTCDGLYASFTVNGMSGYAVTVVPEPSTLVGLVGLCLGVLLSSARRKR